MADVVVVGGGVSGLGTALFLSRRGHVVTVVERDDTPMPADVEAAFDWDRRGAPQVRHSHALLGRLRKILAESHPDVLETLLASGATEIKMSDRMPSTLDDRSPQPGDDELVMIAARRTTFEWVLRRTILDEGLVAIHTGHGVDGLLTAPGEPPTVTGVVLEDGTEVRADVVVAANGRRSTAPDWLTDVGCGPIDETFEDTGIVYYSRFYRLADGAEFPGGDRLIGGDLTYLKFGVFWGDNRTFSITLAIGEDDRELRRLRDPAAFDTTAMALPLAAEWIRDGRAAPITGVHSMAGLLNRKRAWLRDGEPVALGFHVVGDAHVATNPLHGRGCSTGMWQAQLLTEALEANPDDPRQASIDFCQAVEEVVLPWYDASVQSDRSNRAAVERARAEAAGETPPEPTQDDFMRSVLREGLSPATRTDAVVWRAFNKMVNLLAPPNSLLDPDVAGRVLAVWQDRDNRPPPEPLGPERDELLSLLGPQ